MTPIEWREIDFDVEVAIAIDSKAQPLEDLVWAGVIRNLYTYGAFV